MKANLLRQAIARGRGFRAWRGEFGRATISAPSRNVFGWFQLRWHEPDMVRGLDIVRHRERAKRTALDLCKGTAL